MFGMLLALLRRRTGAIVGIVFRWFILATFFGVNFGSFAHFLGFWGVIFDSAYSHFSVHRGLIGTFIVKMDKTALRVATRV